MAILSWRQIKVKEKDDLDKYPTHLFKKNNHVEPSSLYIHSQKNQPGSPFNFFCMQYRKEQFEITF